MLWPLVESVFSSTSFLGSDCDVVHFLSVTGQLGFCFLFSDHRKPDELRERVALRKPWDWVVNAGLPWVLPGGLEARVGRGATGQVCRCAGWCPPSQLQRPSEREKGKRGAGDSGTWESPLLLGSVSRTARAQTQRAGGANAEQRQPWSTAIVSVFILASSFWQGAVWGWACDNWAAQLIKMRHSALQIPNPNLRTNFHIILLQYVYEIGRKIIYVLFICQHTEHPCTHSRIHKKFKQNVASGEWN